MVLQPGGEEVGRTGRFDVMPVAVILIPPEHLLPIMDPQGPSLVSSQPLRTLLLGGMGPYVPGTQILDHPTPTLELEQTAVADEGHPGRAPREQKPTPITLPVVNAPIFVNKGWVPCLIDR